MRALLLLALLAGTALAGAEGAPLAGLRLADQGGAEHDVDAESRARLVMLFRIDHRILAKHADGLLSARLGAQRPLLRIIDGREFPPADRPRLIARLQAAVEGSGVGFLLDWEGAAAARLALDPALPHLVVVAGDGRVAAHEELRLDAGPLTRALVAAGVAAPASFAPDELVLPVGGRANRR